MILIMRLSIGMAQWLSAHELEVQLVPRLAQEDKNISKTEDIENGGALKSVAIFISFVFFSFFIKKFYSRVNSYYKLSYSKTKNRNNTDPRSS